MCPSHSSTAVKTRQEQGHSVDQDSKVPPAPAFQVPVASSPASLVGLHSVLQAVLCFRPRSEARGVCAWLVRAADTPFLHTVSAALSRPWHSTPALD